MEKSTIIGKRIEALIGLFLLVPPVLGVISFTLRIFGNSGNFASLILSQNWTVVYCQSWKWTLSDTASSAAATSAAPIYLALMAMVGAYLIKDSLYSFFTYKDKK